MWNRFEKGEHMCENERKLRVLCSQYLIEGDGDAALAYNLMRLEYSLIKEVLPVKDFEEFKKYLK